MSINIGPAETDDLRPRITVIGIGGAGGNAIANMIASEIEGVDFIVTNTDAQALSTSPAETRIQLGPDITGGLGAGARPEVGKAAAEETVAEIEEALQGVNMVFIAAGMGGGTGTGAAPVIAEVARRMGVLTVGVVTKPFLFEGTRRMRAAEAGIAELQDHVDTLIVIPNQNLFLVAKPETTFKEAFQLADEVLQQGVRSITDLMVMPGLINLDFADVRSVMSEMGKAMMGTGEGEGENRALDAAEQAIANPLLDGVSMQGAKGVIISIIGGEDMKLMEVDEAANHIRDLVDEDANIIWGSAFNPDLAGRIRVSVVATGIEAGAAGDMPRSAAAAFSASRAPKRPVLELGGAEEASAEGGVAEEAAESDYGDDAGASSFEPSAPRIPVIPDPVADAMSEDDEDGDQGGGEPFDLTGMQAGDELGDEDDDVDGIIDPLAGLRGAEDEDEYPGYGDDDSSNDDRIGSAGLDDGDSETGTGSGFGSGSGGTLDLDGEYSEHQDASDDDAKADEKDDLLANADRLAEEDKPVRSGGRRAAILGPGGGPAGGSTLFERMANLSRSSASDDDDDEDGDGDGDGDDTPALSIPRFLGRQNNQ